MRIIKQISNVSKFSFAEIFSDQNGKSSGTSFCGIIITIVGTICFLLGCIDKMWITKTTDIITQSITFVLIGASLLGLKKVVGDKNQFSYDEKDGSTSETNTNSQ